MKEKIHPKYVQAKVVCACGNSWMVGSTKPLLKVEVCSRCHPYYTGKEQAIDTGGQVERFRKRFKLSQAGTPAPEPARSKEPQA